MKKILSFGIVFVLVLSLCAVGYAVPLRASDESADEQIALIAEKFSGCKQNEAAGAWSYTVMDLDHNGRLELIAASEQGSGKTTYVKAWEVSEDGTELQECKVSIPEDESFPDILTGNADTFYNPVSDTWFYTFYDNIVLSPEEVYYARCFVTFQNGELGFRQLAVQHTVLNSGIANTSYMDNNGNPISGEQYNDAGSVSTVDLAKSSTNFDWVSAEDAAEARFADCYAVFKGSKQPLEKEEQTVPPTPAPTPVPAAVPAVFLTITKSPTNESRVTGETAWFVSGATGYTSLSWTFVSPQGGEYSPAGFQNCFPYCSIGGADTTTLTVGNLGAEMSGWSVYCTFYNNGQTARTNTAFLYVAVRQQQVQTQTPTPVQVPTNNIPVYYSYGTFGGYAYDDDGHIEYDYYYPDGSYTTYYWDGSSYTDYLDGSFSVESNDGSYMYVDSDGSYMDYNADGTWNYYDSYDDSYSGGVDYDQWENYYGFTDDQLVEIYSDVYGWGYIP